jgi:hypothetical protein
LRQEAESPGQEVVRVGGVGVHALVHVAQVPGIANLPRVRAKITATGQVATCRGANPPLSAFYRPRWSYSSPVNQARDTHVDNREHRVDFDVQQPWVRPSVASPGSDSTIGQTVRARLDLGGNPARRVSAGRRLSAGCGGIVQDGARRSASLEMMISPRLAVARAYPFGQTSPSQRRSWVADKSVWYLTKDYIANVDGPLAAVAGRRLVAGDAAAVWGGVEVGAWLMW